MIDINELRGRNAIGILREYQGKNPYIKKLKNKLLLNKKITLTTNQSDYIVNHHHNDPIVINKIVSISEYLGEELKKQYNLKNTPTKILIQYMLADLEKTYHIYGKLYKNQEKADMYFIPKTQVLDDPYFEEIEVDIDFDKYEKIDTFKNIDGTTGRKLFELQKEGIKFLLTRKGAVLADQMGAGKALEINELAYTPNGLKKIGDIKVGDYVIGSNGLPTLVEGVYPQPIKDLYRVTFNDGFSILCCEEHLWTVYSRLSGPNSNSGYDKSHTLSIKQMLDEDLIIETKGIGYNKDKTYKIRTYYKEPNGNNKWQIPIVKPIQFENEYTLPIEPYLLGIILGDGHIREKYVSIKLHKDDFDEIFQTVENLNENQAKDNFRICSFNFGSILNDLNLSNTRSHTKFIPDIYKYSSVEDRLAILQGLMDTDAHCSKSKINQFKGTEYTTTSEQLANDVAEIVHSLGGIVRIGTKIGSYKKPDGTKVICKKVYRLNIKLSNGMNPFRLKRKADLYNQPEKYKVGRYIKDISFERKGESVCIKVSAPDHLFVMKHGIVTHNTVQATVAALETGAKKILIVCPSSVKINWQREINYFQEFDTAIINGKKWEDAKFTIINYDILKNFHTVKTDKNKDDYDFIENQHLLNSKFDLCIIDEAHNLKNKDSIRGAIMSDICNNIDRVWLLSGTPVANRPMDYYNLLKLIKHPITNNWKFYATRYCDGKQINTRLKNGRTKKVWLTNGASNLDELNLKTKNVFLRRLTEEFTDMPDKTVIPVINELSTIQRREYERLWDDYLLEREKIGKNVDLQKDLVELGLLRKYIAMQTIPYTIDIANEILSEGKKVVIFTCFTDELLELANYFGNKCVVHYGQMSEKEKQLSVDEFQNREDGPMVFIGNIKSAGVGITLTRAHYLIFNSFNWVPGDVEQSEFRCFRIGQKNNVKIYYNLFSDTIITQMWYVLKYKQNIIDQIIGNNETKIESESEMIELMVSEIIKNNEGY